MKIWSTSSQRLCRSLVERHRRQFKSLNNKWTFSSLVSQHRVSRTPRTGEETETITPALPGLWFGWVRHLIHSCVCYAGDNRINLKFGQLTQDTVTTKSYQNSHCQVLSIFDCSIFYFNSLSYNNDVHQERSSSIRRRRSSSEMWLVGMGTFPLWIDTVQ